MNNSERYIQAAPVFQDLDTEEDSKNFLKTIAATIGEKTPDVLIIDITNCYLDYWGCAPLVEGCMKLIGGSSPISLRTLGIVTSMEFGLKQSYASLLFKGSDFEKSFQTNDFLSIAVQACTAVGVELKIWVVPQDFTFQSADKLLAPKFVLSSK